MSSVLIGTEVEVRESNMSQHLFQFPCGLCWSVLSIYYSIAIQEEINVLPFSCAPVAAKHWNE